MHPRVIVVIAFALLAPAAGAQTHRVFVAREEAPRKPLLRDLNDFIDSFKKAHTQLEFVKTPKDAPMAYVRFDFSDKQQLIATYADGGPEELKIYSRGVLSQTQPLSELLDDVLERKLFDAYSGIYLPLPLARCEAGPADDEVRAVIARRKGIGLDDNVTYQLGEWEPPVSDGVPRVLARAPVLFRIGELPGGDGADNALFEVSGVSSSVRNFKRVDCSARPARELLLIPMLVLPLNHGARN